MEIVRRWRSPVIGFVWPPASPIGGYLSRGHNAWLFRAADGARLGVTFDGRDEDGLTFLAFTDGGLYDGDLGLRERVAFFESHVSADGCRVHTPETDERTTLDELDESFHRPGLLAAFLAGEARIRGN